MELVMYNSEVEDSCLHLILRLYFDKMLMLKPLC